MGKTGIIIVNTGSPATPTSEAVAEYLRAFLSDPRICPMNPRLWRLILNRFIIPKRAPVSAAKYASIWTDEGAVGRGNEIARAEARASMRAR